MGAKDRSAATLSAMAHRHFMDRATGDGVQTEFPLSHALERLDDLLVFVGGAAQLSDLNGTVNQYAVRGITPGYPGDSNFVKFHAAPGAGVAVLFYSLGG